eukprot:symbB.v1.2.002077.t2/scaffold111.1/size324890/11
MLHLQQSLQLKLPGLDFWDNNTESVSFCRKITFDFFLMETGRIFLRGEPPFRETCDMLCPDALGAVPINQDQWILRTCFAKNGQGIAQIFVWGEQPLPEVIELKQMAKEEEEERERIRLEKLKQEEEDNLDREIPNKDAQKSSKDQPPRGGSKEEVKVEDMTEEDARKHRQIQATEKAKREAEAKKDRSMTQTDFDMTALTRTAATMDEENSAPVDLLPPTWMKHCTIAPAQQTGSDPPLPTVMKQPKAIIYRQTQESDRRRLARAKKGKEEEGEEASEGEENSNEGVDDAPGNCTTLQTAFKNTHNTPKKSKHSAWRVLAAQQRSGEQKEMLDLIESSNGWILHLQRERWSYEEQLQAADLQIQELQEALEAEEKSKEALLLQLQQLQEHRTHRPWLRAVEPVAVQQ